MLPEVLAALPAWLVVGLAVGGVASVAVAGAFLAGGRLFPTPDRGRGAGRVGGDDRRRAEIRAYIERIGEPYREDAEVHGRRVAFYLAERDVAITFDPGAYFHIEEAGTAAVLCEHEMPGRHLGRRLPFEVPGDARGPGPAAGGGSSRDGSARGGPGEAGSAAGSSARAGSNGVSSGGRPGGRGGPGAAGGPAAPFERLGVGPDADPETVKQAYRARVKEVHPDHGGDPEEFRRVREAYAAARDRAERRAG